MTNRDELTTLLGREFPKDDPIRMTREERRTLTKKVHEATGYVLPPGMYSRITHVGGEPIEICEELHDDD